MITANRIQYSYYNWEVVLYDNVITFKCTLFLEGEGTKTLLREYDIPRGTRDITFEGTYISLELDNNKMYQFKLEGDSCIVGDVWKDGDVVDSIAMHDFWGEF